MKALVTGGTGFVGSHLIDALLERGDDVTALVRSPARARRLEGTGVRLVHGDLFDLAALHAAAHAQDVVYHVAGLVAARDEAEFLRANREGTANLLEAATAGGAGRFVLVSSLAAGGPAARGSPLRGDEPPRPVTAYGRSKLAAEDVVRRGTLPWVILRPPLVYGPRDTEVLKLFKLARTGVAPVFGRGEQELSAVFGPDLAHALTLAGRLPGVVGRVYLACHPELFTSATFARAVGQALGIRVRILPVPEIVGRGLLAVTGAAAKLAGQATVLSAEKANEFFEAAWTGDPTPLMRDAGWEPVHDLEHGLALTAEWYRREGWL